jgi:hypothetical protein
MFDSLDEQMKHELGGQESTKDRIIRYAVISAISIVVIVALYEVVRIFG